MRWNAASINSLPPDRRQSLLDGLDEAEVAFLLRDWRFWARESQLPPDGDWRIWLFWEEGAPARPAPEPNGLPGKCETARRGASA